MPAYPHLASVVTVAIPKPHYERSPILYSLQGLKLETIFLNTTSSYLTAILTCYWKGLVTLKFC